MSGKVPQPCQPDGFHFLDRNLDEIVYVQQGEWQGWLFKKFPDGNWVSLREATPEDKEAIVRRMAVGN